MATKAKSSPKKQQSAKQARTPSTDLDGPMLEELRANMPEDTAAAYIEEADNQLQRALAAVELLKRAALCPSPLSADSAFIAAHAIEQQIEAARGALREAGALLDSEWAFH